jgi:MFS transporter, YNFM family, putative membrane transport protein
LTQSKDSISRPSGDLAAAQPERPHLGQDFDSQLRALMMGGFCSMVSARICDAMLPVLAAELGGTVSSVAQVIASFALAYGLTQLVYGPMGDRFGKLRVIFFTCGAACLGAIACALSQNLTALTWARFFAGATAAGVIPLSIAWIGDSVPYAQRQAVMAKYMAGTVTGLIIGQILGGLASDTVGWRSAFWGVAVLYALSVVSLRRHRHPIQNTPQRVPGALTIEPGGQASQAALTFPFLSASSWWTQVASTYWKVLKKPAASLVFPIVMAEGFLVFSATSFVPSFVHDRDLVSLSKASLAVAGFGVGGLIYAWRSQQWLRRLGETGFAKIGACLFGVGMCFLALMPGFIFALIGCFFAGIGFYMLHNTLQTLGSQVSPESRGSAMSLFAFSLFAGQTMGISAAAWAVGRFGYLPVFIISGGFTTILGFILAKGLPKSRAHSNVTTDIESR